MFDNLSADIRRMREVKSKPFPWYVLESLLFENGFQAVVLYRLAHWFCSRGIPILGPFFARLGLFLTGIDIWHTAEIGPGLRIAHGTGTVVGGSVKIGRDALLLHGITIGGAHPSNVEAMPVLGDRVFVGAGACIIGALRIGDDVFIGVNAIVAQDIPDGSKVISKSGISVRSTEK